jgi:hypothetical protein
VEHVTQGPFLGAAVPAAWLRSGYRNIEISAAGNDTMELNAEDREHVESGGPVELFVEPSGVLLSEQLSF